MNTQTLDQEWKYWYPRVYGYFYKRLNDQWEVEELTSVTLTNAFLKKDEIQNFKAYIWKIAHNQLVTYIRTKSTKLIPISTEDLDMIADDTPTFEVEIQIESSRSQNYLQTRSQILDCVDKNVKNSIDREILKQSIGEDKNSTELGQIHGLAPTTIRKKLSRAISKIKDKCLEIWNNLTNSVNPTSR